MALALARLGHRVTVACYAHGVGEPDPEYEVVRTPRVPGYDNLRAGPDFVKPLLDAALAVQLARIGGDIVHAHNYEAPLAAALARVRTRTPMVYCAHNTMGEELHTYFDGRVARGVARRVGRFLDLTVPRLADHALAIHDGAVPVLEALGCPRVTAVPPGIDPHDLRPCRPASLPPGPWVVYAGNPDTYQDLDVLIEAMRLLPDVGLLMVSASSLEHWRSQGLPKAHFVETSDFEEVRSLLAAATVAALPRTVCTGFPIKLLNNLGMGLPTIAAEGSARALPGVVSVPNHDATAMAKSIQSLIDRPEHCMALGQSAREYVLSDCTWEARAVELVDVYRSVLRRLSGWGDGSSSQPV